MSLPSALEGKFQEISLPGHYVSVSAKEATGCRLRLRRLSCMIITVAATPSTVTAPPPIKVHRGPMTWPIQPRIGEPIGVPPIKTMM